MSRPRCLRRHSASPRQGFTLVEIVAAIMLLGLGLLPVLALTLAGTREANTAAGLATAYSTARTALYDPALVDASKSLSDTTIKGFLNGYYVIRTIDNSLTIPGGGGTMDLVRVQVYGGESGNELAGLTSYLRR